MERHLVSIKDACGLVGVSRRTIYSWIATGKLEYCRTAGGAIRIVASTLWRRPGRHQPIETAAKHMVV